MLVPFIVYYPQFVLFDHVNDHWSSFWENIENGSQEIDGDSYLNTFLYFMTAALHVFSWISRQPEVGSRLEGAGNLVL